MKTSVDRILTTHVGSLPRGQELLDMLVAIERGEDVDRDAFRERVANDLDEVIRKQIAAGIDIGGDGELPRIGFSNYVKDRMSGFGGESERGTPLDFTRFPKYTELKTQVRSDQDQLSKSATTFPVPAAQDRVAYDAELGAVKEEMTLFREALERSRKDRRQFTETFVTAATPGIVSTTLLRASDNPAYVDDREYLMDLARELRHEYEYIVEEGHVLQLDAPDLAFERQLMFRDRPLEDFLERFELHIEVLNEALRGIPADRVRLHVCWGNSDSPHLDDVELEPLLPRLYDAQVGALSMPGANPRHQHDFKMFSKYPPPESMVVIPGVIDVSYNYLEHPEVVADRICRYADAVGDPSRVIASTDCGFGTFAGYVLVAEDVAWKKLEIMAEGAQLATERLAG